MSDHSQKKLTGKEEAFIQFYCSNGFNGTQAAIKAGYSENTAGEIACENLKKPHIKEHIDAYKKEQANKNDVTIQEIISNARYIVDAAKVGDDLSNMTKGNEQLGKTIGAFTDVQKNEGEIKIILDHQKEGEV